MSKVTTEDCKNFIKEQRGLTSTVKIKREKKYKDINGDVIREFSIEGYDNCFIIENKNGDLSVINADEIITKPVKSESVQDFNAKRFLKKYIKKLEEDEGEDDEEALSVFMKETAKLSPENKTKVANEFCFYFPYETYGNMTKFIVNGLDTPMIRKGEFRKESLCVIFYDSVDSEPDLLVSHILEEILPEYFHKVDEYHFEVSLNEITEELTIKDMIALLENYGFTYKNNTEYLDTNGCMLKKLNLK
jgi:hypothetical protein